MAEPGGTRKEEVGGQKAPVIVRTRGHRLELNEPWQQTHVDERLSTSTDKDVDPART